MDEAPKELWADWDYDATDGVCGVHTQKKYASYYEPECPPIRYVRADLVDAEREWVGLEDEYGVGRFYTRDFLDGAKWAEEKLKELNT